MTIRLELPADGSPIIVTARSADGYEVDCREPLSDEQREQAQEAVWAKLDADREDFQERSNPYYP